MIIIDLDELDNHLQECLIDLGYVPAQEEIEDITDIVIQYFMLKGLAKWGGG